MYCRHCGAEMPEDAKFCERCGQAVAGAAKRPADGRSSATRRRWVIGGLFLLALAGIGTAAFLLFRGPRAGDVMISPIDGAKMVYVPTGEFLMGTSDDAQVDAWLREHPNDERTWLEMEKPQHRVYLDGYWIDKYEVTVRQYRQFCQATGREMPPAPPSGWQDDHPVVKLTWDDAAAYARWAGKRLPTEAEWEKAARGTDGRVYPWGNAWDASKCANSTNSSGGTKPVGSYPAGTSPYGALDMAGSVLEWCADWYEGNYYSNSPQRNPKGPSSGGARVLRGGSCGQTWPIEFRGAARYNSFHPRRAPIVFLSPGDSSTEGTEMEMYPRRAGEPGGLHRAPGDSSTEAREMNPRLDYRNNFAGFRCARSAAP